MRSIFAALTLLIALTTNSFAQDNTCDTLKAELTAIDSQVADLLAEELGAVVANDFGAGLEEISNVLGTAGKLAQQPYLQAFQKWEDALLDETQKLAKLFEKNFIIDVDKALLKEGRDIREWAAKGKEIADGIRGIMALAEQVRRADEFDPARTLKTLSEAYGPLKDLIAPYADLVPGIGPFLSYYGDTLNHAATKLADLQKRQDYKRHVIDNVFNPDGIPDMVDKRTERRLAKLQELEDRHAEILDAIHAEPDCDFQTGTPGVDEDQQDYEVANAVCRQFAGYADGESPYRSVDSAQRDLDFEKSVHAARAAKVLEAQAFLIELRRQLAAANENVGLRENDLQRQASALLALVPDASRADRLLSAVDANYLNRTPARISHPACNSHRVSARQRGLSKQVVGQVGALCATRKQLDAAMDKIPPLKAKVDAAIAALAAAKSDLAKSRTSVRDAFQTLLKARTKRAKYLACMNAEDTIPGHLDISGRYINSDNGTVYEVASSDDKFVLRYTPHLPYFAAPFGITSGEIFLTARLKNGTLVGTKQVFTPLKKLEIKECGFQARTWVNIETLIWEKGRWLSLTNPYYQIPRQLRHAARI